MRFEKKSPSSRISPASAHLPLQMRPVFSVSPFFSDPLLPVPQSPLSPQPSFFPVTPLIPFPLHSLSLFNLLSLLYCHPTPTPQISPAHVYPASSHPLFRIPRPSPPQFSSRGMKKKGGGGLRNRYSECGSLRGGRERGESRGEGEGSGGEGRGIFTPQRRPPFPAATEP